MRLLSIASLAVVLVGCASLHQDAVRYDQANRQKALAIDSRGVWSMSQGQASEEAAINQALEGCALRGGVNCVVSKLNELAIPASSGSEAGSEFSGTRISCDGLGKAEAYRLLMSGHRYLDRDGDGHPCEWNARSYSTTKSQSISPSSGNCHYVSGYRRKNGTYVSGHMRCR